MSVSVSITLEIVSLMCSRDPRHLEGRFTETIPELQTQGDGGFKNTTLDITLHPGNPLINPHLLQSFHSGSTTLINHRNCLIFLWSRVRGRLYFPVSFFRRQTFGSFLGSGL